MDSTYKITAVTGQKPWSSQKGGPMVDYTIEIDGLDGPHTLTQKAQTAAPEVGEQLFGHSEPQPPWPSGDPRNPKFKKAMQGSGFRGNGGRDLSPEAQARIDASGRAQGRAHAQEMALRLADLQLKSGQRTEIDGKGLVPLIDWFYDDAQAAKKDGYRS